MLRIRQINDIKVKVPKNLSQYKDMRPPKNANMFPEPNPNVFIVAKKNSGKTVALFNIMKNTIGRNTIVIFFVSTINSDGTYLAMKEWLDKKDIEHRDYTDIIDEEGVDNLKVLADSFKQMAEEREEKRMEQKMKGKGKKRKFTCLEDVKNGFYDDEEEDDEPVDRLPYQTPDYFIVYDDISEQLKHKSLPTLLKKNRHIKVTQIISTQYFYDLDKSARRQCDYILVFKGLSEDKLKEVFDLSNTSLTFDIFYKLYKRITKPAHSFLYIDCHGNKNKFRQNFDKLVEYKEK